MEKYDKKKLLDSGKKITSEFELLINKLLKDGHADSIVAGVGISTLIEFLIDTHGESYQALGLLGSSLEFAAFTKKGEENE